MEPGGRPPGPYNNAATGAVVGTTLFAKATPNKVLAFEASRGSLQWASTSGTDAFSYQPLTYANGVLYTLNNVGMLIALEAHTGRVLLHRPVGVDAGVAWRGGAGAGVAVARNTVYAPCDAAMGGLPGAGPGVLVAHRAGGPR